MKAIAKDDLYYPEYNYTNWTKGKSYDCWEEYDLLRITDERGVIFNFFKETRDCLNDRFDFVENEDN